MAQRAVLCALGMQQAMGGVNEQNLQRGWPEIEMGIALHTGEVVVGNIGSTKRSKYGVVGRTINTTARIESFTVGGQVVVSPTVIRAADRGLILGDEVEVHAKVIRPLDESGNRYFIHFTSVPPGVRARLNRLATKTESP